MTSWRRREELIEQQAEENARAQAKEQARMESIKIVIEGELNFRPLVEVLAMIVAGKFGSSGD